MDSLYGHGYRRDSFRVTRNGARNVVKVRCLQPHQMSDVCDQFDGAFKRDGDAVHVVRLRCK